MKKWLGVVALLVLLGSAAVGWMGRDRVVVLTDPAPLTLDPPFRYPIELWDAGVEGETLLMVHVTETGAVDSVYVLVSSGQAAFDSAAIAGARTLAFAPGRRDGRRIATWARLPVRFRLPLPEPDPAPDPAPGTGAPARLP